MAKKIVTSPEMASKEISGKGVFYRAAAYFIRPFSSRLRNYYLKKKWSQHSDSRSLDWEWGETNYNRIAVVNLLLNKFRDPAYLEIGCASNALFDSVPAVKKIGVDPSSGGNIRKTSDDFFLSNKDQFDVVFIDGLHTYEQVRRDVINSIKSLRQGGWIALHDMLPRNWIEHHVPIVSSGIWTGDVWKVAFELMETEGIEFNILKIDLGVGVIKVIDPDATLEDLTSTLSHQEFSYYYDNLEKLPILEWDDAQKWLRS